MQPTPQASLCTIDPDSYSPAVLWLTNGNLIYFLQLEAEPLIDASGTLFVWSPMVLAQQQSTGQLIMASPPAFFIDLLWRYPVTRIDAVNLYKSTLSPSQKQP